VAYIQSPLAGQLGQLGQGWMTQVINLGVEVEANMMFLHDMQMYL